MKLRAVKGMNDILPAESLRFAHVEKLFREAVELYGFAELRTPLVEELSLFQKSTGETSEVVQKQMFLLAREGEFLALRPEGTPSAARVYIAHKVHTQEPVTKWYYIGPMFRAERPQRGRYRQFHQAGCELYGDPGPHCDAEMIDMLYRMAVRMGLSDVTVEINSLGGPGARREYRERLVAYFEPRKESLSDHARERLLDNPLRILDSKDERDKTACAGAPTLRECLSPEDETHFIGLTRALDTLGTPYRINPQLVRGLDYYTRTCFEVIAQSGDIGSQSAILGGGRYDGMLEGLGGPAVPAIGFAMGLERVLLALGERPLTKLPLCFIAPMGEKATLLSLRLAAELREAGLRVELETRGGSLKSMLRRADSLGAQFCVVMGESEVKKGVVALKDLSAHTQIDVDIAKLYETIKNSLVVPEPEAAQK